MAQVDTGLGWSANGDYLIENGPQYMGDLVIPAYRPNTDVFSSRPSIADAMRGGATFQSDGVTYYIAVWCSDASSYSGSLELAVYGTHGRTLCMALICDTEFYMYYPRLYITDGTNEFSGNWNSGVSGALDADTGLYVTHRDNIFWDLGVTWGTLTPGTAKVGATLQDILNQFDPVTMHCYKLNYGYAVACFAKWLTTEGTRLVSPILISSVPAATVQSYDGITPADPQSSFGPILHDGMQFYMTILPGYDADSTIAQSNIVPVIDLTQFGAAYPIKLFKIIADPSVANIQVTNSPDPYSTEGGASGEEGGDGDDPEDDPVEEETMPIPAVVGLGFSTIYVPTQTDLYNLAAYLWGGNLDLDNFLKLFANPMDSILGLSAVPLVLSGTYEPIYLGGQLLQGITMPRYTGRTAVKVDMGTVTIGERWGSYLDYDPYTELAVYVPFVGIKNIKADDVMGKTIRLMYDIDILSGACIAYIRPEGGSPLYEWSGQCAMQIPITGANWDNIFNTAINTAATLGGALFAPASAPVLGGAVASAASQAIAAKPRIERSGAMNGVTGFLGQLRPYIIRTIPEAYIPNDQNKFIGYPSYVSVNLGSLTGYNEIASIHLENIPATGDELAELESILKGGAIF